MCGENGKLFWAKTHRFLFKYQALIQLHMKNVGSGVGTTKTSNGRGCIAMHPVWQ